MKGRRRPRSARPRSSRCRSGRVSTFRSAPYGFRARAALSASRSWPIRAASAAPGALPAGLCPCASCTSASTRDMDACSACRCGSDPLYGSTAMAFAPLSRAVPCHALVSCAGQAGRHTTAGTTALIPGDAGLLTVGATGFTGGTTRICRFSEIVRNAASAYDCSMSLGGSPPLLDRTPELSAIDAALSSAVLGKGSTLLVEGEAGIGKTRLLLEARKRAADAGMTVLSARAAEFEGGYAWGVVRQLFDPLLRARGGRLLRGDAAALAGPALSHGSRPGVEDAFSVLHGLYWLTVDVTQRASLLLAVDDLHWADRPSLNFISHLVRRLDGLPLLLVLTVREPRSATVQERVATASLAAEAGVSVLRPSALGAAACAELVRTGLGADPAPAFLQACREATGGNPLLVNALLASLAAEGVRGRADEVPRLLRLAPGTVSRCVLLQLARMAPSALAAARAVAVLGTAATTARAGRLAGLDEDVWAEAVGALMAERLVEGDRALRFVHPLVRSAVYQELAPPLRQRWHQRAARMLDGEGARAEEVAIHLLAAGTSGDDWVVDRLRKAAGAACRRGAADVGTGHDRAGAGRGTRHVRTVRRSRRHAGGGDRRGRRREPGSRDVAASGAAQRRTLGSGYPPGHPAAAGPDSGQSRGWRATRPAAARQPRDRARRCRAGSRPCGLACPRGTRRHATADVGPVRCAPRDHHRAAVRGPRPRGATVGADLAAARPATRLAAVRRGCRHGDRADRALRRTGQ